MGLSRHVMQRIEDILLVAGLAMMGGAVVWCYGIPGAVFVAGFIIYSAVK